MGARNYKFIYIYIYSIRNFGNLINANNKVYLTWW